MNPDETPKEDSIPINGIDWCAYRHDLAYRRADNSGGTPEEILSMKHDADRVMIKELDELSNLTIGQRLTRFFVKKIIQGKVKFGFGIKYNHHGNNCIKCLLAYGSGLSEIEAKLKHKGYRKPKFYRKIENFSKDEIWYADIMVMPRDNGYKYILTILDGFTRFAWCIPLKSKKGEEVYNAFLSIGHKSNRLCVDEGKEFYNSHMYKLYHFEKNKERIKRNGEYINKMYSIYGESKNALIERFNRTIGDKLWKRFSLQGNEKWVKILPEVVKEYNNRIHSSIGMKPKDVYAHPEKLVNDVERIEKSKNKFSVGDEVYIYKYKDKFEKGRTGYWKVSERFRVKKVKYTNPITYIIEDKDGDEILGSFYANQLTAATFL